MKVSELINLLAQYDGDHEVILSSDAAGNTFSKISDIDEGVIVEEYETRSRTEVDYQSHPDDVEDLLNDGYDSMNAICIWP